ncbi:MAG TPA: hypothetical protein VFN24_12765 [Microbacterium sp.]|jgi:hypothetical protein|nr:hypothetical protein [Microbacterium sp.]
MTTFTDVVPVRGAAPSPMERLLLRAAWGIESFAVAHLARRAAAQAAATAQIETTDRRRDAQGLGAVGILPR